MKKYVRGSTSTWPSPEYWKQCYSYIDEWDISDELEELGAKYFYGPEDAVQTRLNLTYEPCREGMYVDINGDSFEDVVVIHFSWGDWYANELDLASQSSSASEYESKFESWIRDVIQRRTGITR